MEQQKLDLQKERLSLNIDVQRKERKYRQNERLYKEKLIAREDYLQAKEDYELALETRHVVQERQKAGLDLPHHPDRKPRREPAEHAAKYDADPSTDGQSQR